MATTSGVSRKGNGIKAITKALKDKYRAKVGIIANPRVATIAAYNEYGWTQQVTQKQVGYMRLNYGVNLRAGSTLSSPPRPFLRGTAKANIVEWKDEIKNGIKALGLKRMPFVMKAVARLAQTDVQNTIRNNATRDEQFPDRSAMTLAIYAVQDALTSKGSRRKIQKNSGSARKKALVHSGELLHSIGYEVDK